MSSLPSYLLAAVEMVL